MNCYNKLYTVTANEIDREYRLTPAGILLYLQDAIASQMATWHAAAFDISEDGLMWIVLEYIINIQGEIPVWSEKIEVRLSVTEITAMKTYFDFEMKDSAGNVFSLGSSTWVLIESQSRRPYIHSMDYVFQKSKINPNTLTTRHPRIRFQKADKVISSRKYKTQINDIDFNGHVCNRTYLSIAFGCLEDNLLEKNIVSNLLVHYIKETYLDDTLTITCHCTSDTYIFEILNGQNELSCSIQMKISEKKISNLVKNIVKRL